jgi:hypothetical protein
LIIANGNLADIVLDRVIPLADLVEAGIRPLSSAPPAAISSSTRRRRGPNALAFAGE